MFNTRVKENDGEKQSIEHATDCLLTKPEVAKRVRKSKRTIDLWMRQGKLPYIKLGKSVLFDWRAVMEHLSRFRVN